MTDSHKARTNSRASSVVLLDAEGITVIRGKRRSVVPWARVHTVVMIGASSACSLTAEEPPGSSSTSTPEATSSSGAWPRRSRIDYPAVPGPTSKLCSERF
jgi:hypothetical protein